MFDAQPSLFDPIVNVNAAGLTLEQRFAAFHAANPHVYAWLRDQALSAKRRGRRVGIKMLYEVLRWQVAMNTSGDEAFRLNNNWPSFYARLLMEREPELAGYFDTRTQTWSTN